MIEISHLVKKYGNHVAVDDLNLTIEPGKIYGFLGPNGAGKSTTMNMITGYLGATSGEIKINGYDILSQPEEAKKCVGYLPELPPLYTDMTVKEYLDFAAELKQINKDKRAAYVADAMQATKTAEVQRRLIKNLSKGYRQRVGLAQAILGYPEIIILDEPTVGLDPKQITEMRELIHTLKEKHTVILSSHILSEVSTICDYIFIISNGKLVASDTTDNLLHMMSGGAQIEVLVKAASDAVKALLETQTDIELIRIEDGTEENTAYLRVASVNPAADVREQIFMLCAKEQIILLEMKSCGKTLEDIFLDLTSKNPETVSRDRDTEAADGEVTDSAAIDGEVIDKEEAEDDSNL